VLAAPASDGGLYVVLGVQGTNIGQSPATTVRVTQLVDERGRAFTQTGANVSGLDLQVVKREYGANVPVGGIAPGATAREVWGFLVAPDVQRLTLVEREHLACGLRPGTPVVPESLTQAHATTVTGERARLTATAAARARDRAAARPTGQAYGLVGQRLHFCAGIPSPKVPFDAVVEQAEGVELPGGRLRVVAVVRATNLGARPEGTFRATQVRDERLQAYPQADVDQVRYTEIERDYGVATPGHPILPGLSERQAWVFHVAPDVQQLRLAQVPQYACVEPATATPRASPFR
jgi:hypothetical protein